MPTNNGFLDAQEYSNALMLLLKNQLVWGRLVDGQFKNQVTDQNGLSVSIKAPPQFVAQDGATLAAQRMLVGSRTVAVDKYKNVHINVGDLEAVQSFNDLMKNSAMMSAASALAHAIDKEVAERALEFPSMAGAIGQTIESPAEFFPMHTQLMAQGVPNEQLSAVLSFVDGEKIRGSLVGGNIDGTNLSALQKTKIPMMSEIDSYATQQLPSYTNGDHTMSAGPAVKGASQNVNYKDVKTALSQSLIIDGLGNSKSVKRGETFTIAGVYEYDWRQQKKLTNLQRFVVLADGTTHASDGSITVTVAPPIIVPATSDGVDTVANTAFATVDSVPADDAAITFDGVASTTYTPRVAFHKRALALVSAKLERPMTGESSFTTDKQTGISIRYWRGSDIATGLHIHRWDCIFGVINADRRLGVRGYGAT